MRIITGRARGLKLTTPKNWDVRPTADRVKESLFNIIGSKIAPYCRQGEGIAV